MFKFNDYISIEINCWYFCSIWLFTFLFKIECWYFCSIEMLLILFKTDCWFFYLKWLLIFVFLFNFDIFVQIDCWHFSSKWYFCSNWLCIICSNWSFIFLIKLINQFSVQNACPCFFFNLRFLFKLIVLIFVHNWLLIFLIKIDC